MALSELEKERYRRQLLVHSWNQEKLRTARVLIAGVGGLGSASAFYLASAGVGTLRLCDADVVELSDLNRQVLFDEKSIGRPKVREAGNRLARFNSSITIEALLERITEENAGRIIKGCDLIVDGLDNMPSRFILNRHSVKTRIPYVYGAVQGWQGFIGLFHPPSTACLACVIPQAVQMPGPIPVAGVLPGTIGLLQATEALKYLMGVERALEGRLLIYDGRDLSFDTIELAKNPACPVCSRP
jgi:adenylyltransferase/sulfurtransferase